MKKLSTLIKILEVINTTATNKDDLMFVINELKEVKRNLRPITLYKEDFKPDSLENEVLFLGGELQERVLYYEKDFEKFVQE